MPRLTIRLDDELYHRLIDHSRTTGTTPSAYLRDLLVRFEGTDPLGYHNRFDDIDGTTLQILAMLGTWMAEVAPSALEAGLEATRTMLSEHGLRLREDLQ